MVIPPGNRVTCPAWASTVDLVTGVKINVRWTVARRRAFLCP